MLIVPRAIGLLREVVVVLTESAPVGVHVAEIREHLREADGVVDVHDVHVWQLTRERRCSARMSSWKTRL